MSAKGGEIVFDLVVRTRDFTKGLRTAQKELKETNMTTRMMGISIQRAGAAMQKGARAVGRAMSAVSLATAGAGIAAVKAASDWESSFTDVAKVLDPARTNIQKLEKDLLEMSKVIPLSTTELAEVAASAGRLGIEGEKNILKFTEVVSAMGVATNMTAEEAGDSMARFANIMNMPIDEVDRLGSTIVNLGNNLPTTEREIMKMGTRMASAGRAAGLSESEVMSFAGALSATGVSAERGGTNMSLFLRTVTTATQEGGDRLNTLAKVAGMTADEFKQKYQKDASGAIVDFLKGLNKMEKDGVSTADVFKDLGVNGSIMHEVLGNLSGNIELVSDALEYGNSGWEENTALLTEAQQRYDTFASLLQLLRNRFKYLGIIIGGEIIRVLSKFIKALNPVFDVLDQLVDWFAELDEKVKDVVIYIGMAIAAFTGIGAIMAFVVAGIMGVVSALGLFLAGASAIGLTLSGLIAIVTGVIAVITALVVGIGSVVTSFGIMVARSENMRDAVSSAFNGIYERALIVFEKLSEFGKDIWKKLTDFWENDIGDFVSRMEDVFAPILDKMKELGEAKGIESFADSVDSFLGKASEKFDQFLEVVNVILDGVVFFSDIAVTAFTWVMDVIGVLNKATKPLRDSFMDIASTVGSQFLTTFERVKSIFETLLPIIEFVAMVIGASLVGSIVLVTTVLSGLIRAIVPVINALLSLIDVVLNVVLSITAFLTGDFDAALDYWNKAVESSINFFKDMWDALVGFVEGIVDAIIGWLKVFDDLSGGIITDAVNFIVESFESFKESVTNIVEGVVSAVVDFFSSMGTGASETVSAMVEGVVGFFTDLYERASEVVSGIVEAITGFFSKLWEDIVEITEPAVTTFVDFFNNLREGVLEIVDSVVTGVVEFFTNMYESVTEVVGNIVDSVVEFFVGLYEGIVEHISLMVETVLDYFTGMGDSVGESVGGLVESVIEFFSNMWEGIVEFVSGIIDSVSEGFNQVREIIDNILMAVKDIISNTLNFIYETFMNVLGVIVALVTGDFSSIKEIMSSQIENARELLSGIWDSIKSMFGETIQEILTGVEERFLAIRDTMSNIISDAKDAVMEVVGDLYAQVIDFIGAIPEGILNLGGQFLEAGRNIISSLGEGVRGAFSFVTDPISDLAGRIRGFFPFSPAKEGPLTDINQIDFGGSIADAVRNSEADALMALGQMTNNMKNVVTSFLSTIGDMFKAGFSNVGAITAAAMGTVVKAITTGFKAVMTATTSAMKGVGNAVKSAFTSINKNISSAMKASANVIKSSFNSINSVVRSSTRNMASSIRSAFSAINTNIKSSMVATTNVIRTSFSTINSATRSAMSSMNASTTSSFRTMMNAIRTSMNSIRTAKTSAWRTISSTTRSLINSMVSSSTSRLRSFANAVRSSFSSVRSSITSGMRSAVNSANASMSSFVSAGRSVGSSVARGIRNSMGAVRSAASSMASTIRRFLPFSPAKEGALRDITKVRIGESVAEAIKRGTPSAVMAMAKLSQDINNSLQIDPSKIRKGVETSFKRIDGGVKVDYATPSGTHSTLTSAVKGSIEVDIRDEKIVEAINSLGNRIGDLEVVMDGEQVGRIVRPHVNHGNAVDDTLRYF